MEFESLMVAPGFEDNRIEFLALTVVVLVVFDFRLVPFSKCGSIYMWQIIEQWQQVLSYQALAMDLH